MCIRDRATAWRSWLTVTECQPWAPKLLRPPSTSKHPFASGMGTTVPASAKRLVQLGLLTAPLRFDSCTWGPCKGQARAVSGRKHRGAEPGAGLEVVSTTRFLG